jgi:nicotinamidase-related amidase
MPEEIIARVVARVGRAHPFDKLEASKTAFVVVDMQNYYLKPGYLGDVPLARDIVPAINKFAGDLRARGAHVIWVKNASNDTRENWSVFHVGGTATNVCCDVSARDAMMLNFKVIMVPDVLATWTDAEHNATLANFYSIFGDVQTCDEVLASLSRGQKATAA